MALRRSRTRSCAVRRRLRMAASSDDAVSSSSPLSSMLRPICFASSGAGSRTSRTPASCGPVHDFRRTSNRSVAMSVSPMSSSSSDVSRPPREARSSAALTSRAPPIEACACSARSRSASSVWSWRSADVLRVGHRKSWPAPAPATARRRLPRPAARRSRAAPARAASRRRRPRRRRGQARERCGSSAIQKRHGREAHAPA